MGRYLHQFINEGLLLNGRINGVSSRGLIFLQEQTINQLRIENSILLEELDKINKSFYNGIPVLDYPFQNLDNLYSRKLSSNQHKLELVISKIAHKLCNFSYHKQYYFVIKSANDDFAGFVIMTDPEILDNGGNHVRFDSELYGWRRTAASGYNRFTNNTERLKQYIFVIQVKTTAATGSGTVEKKYADGNENYYDLPPDLLELPVTEIICYTYCVGDIDAVDCNQNRCIESIGYSLK